MKSPLLDKPDYVVCTCMGVMHSEITKALEERQATTLQELSNLFGVGTGCSSCVEEVEELLKEYKK
jgi:assimilatory nitrate reductase catalytic subunit